MPDEITPDELQQYNTLISIGLVSEDAFVSLLRNYSLDKLDSFIQASSLDDLEEVWINMTLFYHKLRFLIERRRRTKGKQKTLEEIQERDRLKIANKLKQLEPRTVGRPTKVYDTDPALNKFIKECVKTGMSETVARSLYTMEIG